MAYFLIYLVQGLFIHLLVWQQRPHLEKDQKHFYYIFGERLLAWSQLDLIVWGLINAIYIMPSIIFNTHRDHLDTVASGKTLPTARDFFSIGLTLSLTVFAWIFFRAENLPHAFQFISDLFSWSLFQLPEGSAFLSESIAVYTLLGLLCLFIVTGVRSWSLRQDV